MISRNGAPQYLGELSDYVNVPYEFGENTVMSFLTTGYYHVHGTPLVYPDHANAITLTAGAGAWNLTGSIIEIIPAATLTLSAFDIHFADISSISENAEIQIDLYKGGAGSEELISSVTAERSTVTSPGNPIRIQIPQQSPGTRISARLSSSVAGATTCKIKLHGHYYAG